ncbi:hypothetical protein [Streptomyces neyagawaensis]|uniref:hypothetical protein n=1 Tax=Streptomyces neyagawaensis TaxID=42238 RepID=UPI0006E27226|nr:hypothetical protein [Streptomyces neyagawaensis]MCL6735679.1 hypothetical protein [Streptomyces neyagawaensis]MDE1686702.1 hypothetical protein [Streptomyces neyagawaensis]
MSRTHLAHRSLTSLAAAATLLTVGCSGTAESAHAGGCRENGDWTVEQRAEWLRRAVSFPESAPDDAAVVTHPRTAGNRGSLCEPIAVQVQFWKLTATAAGTDMRPGQHIRLATSGGDDRSIGFPAGLSAGERGGCTGVLMAVYVGGPLTGSELPKDIGHLTPGTAEVRFRTDRVAAYRLLPPSEPESCRANGERTTAPPTTPNPWGSNHP